MQTVLAIGGFDPSSGAGVTADLMVFAAHGLYGLSCITGLTVQSTVGVASVHPVRAEVVSATLACLEADLPPAGIKIGMLATEQVVIAVTEYLRSLRKKDRHIPVVLDPVVRSTSGRELLEKRGVEAMRELLLPLVDWVTPNVMELGVLAGRGSLPREHLFEAAALLQQRCPNLNVVATRGDTDAPDDLLVPSAGEALWIQGTKVESRSTHGTGCAFASALLCRLVSGDEKRAAVRGAKDYVAEAIRTADPMGSGHGPVHHLWPLRR